ncbi:glucose/mannose transport system substrate-binding protein [Spinactinospora alkalitolerans]|uniref:Probable sugar-binding periplasmic protein n=1 Tax=Spinactinospora alkalitolerans TaxID=687207 RepID=A0A852TYM5_9ACTN|nr:ABC transporter substrate-binding protein [Spinactinospora alkalitolerans]NYE48901.1 glucose/mannose transport system substrate-binding protein [Spinactinospora alkalitolerans]
MRARWKVAGAAALTGVLAATGCGGGGGDGGGNTQVEVFSWWTGGGEEAGLNALIEKFQEDNPDIEFVNAAVAGGSGTNAQAVLEGRLQSQDPPDSFQGHAGAELQDYIEAGYLQPLDDFYDEHGLREAYPEQLIDQISYDGSIYSVPVNVHRSNVLWYNPSVLDEAGVDGAPETLDEFIDDLRTIEEETDVIPLAVGAQWTVDHLLESVLLGELGVEAYNALWEPGADWSTPEVQTALERFDEILQYSQEESASEDWQEASKRVVDGEAAFNIMGDWAAGYFVNDLGMTEGEDFAWAPSPGTDGAYMWLSDSFTLPEGAPNQEAALTWLELVSSQEGQDIFNPLKGSIPARTDGDPARYADSQYLTEAMEQWKSDELAGSFWHGVTVNNRWKSDIDTALGLYLQDGDLDTLQGALDSAAQA